MLKYFVALVSGLAGGVGFATIAGAQTVDHPGVCPPHERAWAGIANGLDAVAMNRVFAATPAACPGLRRRISARIVEVESRPRAAPARTASTRTPSPPASRPAESLRPLNIPREIRAAMTPASYASFERQARRALPYFKPNTIQRTMYFEMSVQNLGALASLPSLRNRGCELRFLPRDSTNVAITETTSTTVYRTPYVAETRAQQRNAMCHEPNATLQPGPSDTSVAIVVPGGSPVASSSSFSATATFGQEELEFEADLDPSGSDTRASRMRAREKSASCRHVRRLRPGQWQPGFPFHVYEMNCQSQGRVGVYATTITGTYFFIPELSADLMCGGRVRTQSDLVVAEETTSNVRVLREGDGVIRVKCDYQSSGSIMQGGAPTGSQEAKGEREDVITLQ